MGTAGARDRVVTCAPVVLGEPPLRRDPAVVLEAAKRRVERAFLYSQDVIGGGFDPTRDSVAVRWSADERLEDEDRERALKQIAGIAGHSHPSLGKTMGHDRTVVQRPQDPAPCATDD